MTDEVGVAVIGTGMWANKVHLAAYQAHPQARLVAVYDVDRDRADAAAKQFGAESVMTDYDELLARDDIHAVDVITPNVTHLPLVMAAIRAGKHVMCEKPMAMNVEEASQMTEAARNAGVKNGVNFTWRNGASAQYAKHLVEQGELGRIYHIQACYLTGFAQNPDIPLIWRLQKKLAGTGALGDTGSHIIDIAEWISGQRITDLCADTETFTRERPLLGGDGVGEVDVEDAASLLARFDGGAMGSVLTTFYATGEGMDHRVEIYGQKGSLRISYKDQESIHAAIGGADMQRIPIPDQFKLPEMQQANIRGFIDAIINDRSVVPNFEDGLRNQRVLDAVVASAQNHGWVKVG